MLSGHSRRSGSSLLVCAWRHDVTKFPRGSLRGRGGPREEGTSKRPDSLLALLLPGWRRARGAIALNDFPNLSQAVAAAERALRVSHGHGSCCCKHTQVLVFPSDTFERCGDSFIAPLRCGLARWLCVPTLFMLVLSNAARVIVPPSAWLPDRPGRLFCPRLGQASRPLIGNRRSRFGSRRTRRSRGSRQLTRFEGTTALKLPPLLGLADRKKE